MPRNLSSYPRRFFAQLCIALFAVAALAAAAQSRPAPAVPALLLSDIHFEPFWDPAKVAQLAAAPVSAWDSILASAPSPDRAQRFSALQQTCHARGVDTSYPLLESAFQAIRAQAANARFITVSGDLISHGFDCKFTALFPHATPADYQSFAAKTIGYVVARVNALIPGAAVYIALGNNDSGCGDYRIDPDSAFLAAVGKDITANFPKRFRSEALASFSARGDYSIALPAPVRNARLLVLDDLFESQKYATCAGKADAAPADAQLAWLRRQLESARAAHQKVWVMSHIPPGVDAHGTLARHTGACGNKPPKMFLASDKLSGLLASYGDVVQLALFAHTHMDEIKLLPSGHGPGVALKMVPSISPVDGNHPAFTVAQVDPATAALVDYRVIAASDQTGTGAWKEEYDYARSYQEPNFTAASVAHLLAGFASDPNAKTEPSQSYLRNYFAGDRMTIPTALWPQYVCSLTQQTAASFLSCACAAAR